MANPSTIWAQLALPNPPAGSLPYVLSDGATIGTDVLNLHYGDTTKSLYITNGTAQNYDASKVANLTPVSMTALAGRVTIAAGTNSMVVNNPNILASAFVLVQRRNTDATASQISAVCAAGSVAFVTNANATANLVIDFLVINSSVL